MTKTTTAKAVRTAPTESEAALLAAQQERQRILDAIEQVEGELQLLDLSSHLATATAALDAAVDTGDVQAIQAAAKALQEAKTEADTVGATRLAAQARARTLRAALERAETAVNAAKRQMLRDKDERLCEQLDKEWTHYSGLLDPLIASHVRLAFLANEIWRVRAEAIGARQVNYVSSQTFFQLPAPNGSMPHLPVTARADKLLSRTVDIIPPRVVIPGTPALPWMDRDLVEGVQKSVEEI